MVDESTKKEQDAINWKTYYVKHSFDYLRKRLEKRIVKKHQVRLSTLKKYQLLSFYQKFTTKANLKILKEEMQFDKALKKQPVPDYVNDTVASVANDLKTLLIGNNFQPIDIEKIDIKVNIKTNCDEPDKDKDDVEETYANDEEEEDFQQDEPEMTFDEESEAPDTPAPKPKKKKKKGRQIYTYEMVLEDIENGWYIGKKGKTLYAASTKKAAIGNWKAIIEMLGCSNNDDLARCLRNTRAMKNLRYRMEKGKKVPRANYGKELYSTIVATYRFSPRLQEALGEKKYNEYYAAFDEAMKLFRKDEKKKKDVSKVINFEFFKPALNKKEKQYKRAKKMYEKKVKAYDKKPNKFTKQAMKKAMEEFNKENLQFLLMALYLLQPPRRAQDYKDMKIVKTIPVPNNKSLHKDKQEKKIINYYSTSTNTFSFQKYKTSKRYGQLRFTLNQRGLPTNFGSYGRLRKIIQESVKDYPRDWLIVSPTTGKPYSSVSTIISDIFKQFPNLKQENYDRNITVNTLRHSLVSYLFNIKNISKQEKGVLATLMMHTVATAETNYENWVKKIE